jgi:hypothetical protein
MEHGWRAWVCSTGVSAGGDRQEFAAPPKPKGKGKMPAAVKRRTGDGTEGARRKVFREE